MLLNSTRHPIDEFGGGGLNRSVCQLVDWIFLVTCIRLTVTGMRRSYLKVVAAGGIILFNRFRENDKRVTNEEMCNVFG